MSKRLNRTCICCGTNYRYCNRCAEDAGKPSWLRNFHESIANIIDKIMETATPKPRVKKASQARKELSDKTIE